MPEPDDRAPRAGDAEAVLLWLTTASLTTPFGLTPGIDGLPDGWPAVPTATALGAATAISTITGVAVARWAAAGGRTDVVVADARGDGSPYRAGAWLARHAEVPLHSRYEWVETPS